MYIGHQAGYIDNILLNKSPTVRHRNCKLIVPYNSRAMSCSCCSTYRSTLLTQMWKRAGKENDRTNDRFVVYLFSFLVLISYFSVSYRFIELPDLVARLGNIHASYRALLKQLDRLKSRICEDTEVKGIYLNKEHDAYIKDVISSPESAEHLEKLSESSFEHIFWQQQVEAAS